MRLPVLMYHAIGSFNDGDAGFYTVTPEAFAEQMAYLRDTGHVAVSLAMLGDVLRRRASLPPRAVLITFDDGDPTQGDVAVPILKRYGHPAAFFVTTGRVGQPASMTWEQLRRLLDSGMEVGSHSLSHPMMATLSREDCLRELVESRQVLEEQLRRPVRWFAFPGGSWAEWMRPLVLQAGYDGAFTSDAGYVSAPELPPAPSSADGSTAGLMPGSSSGAPDVRDMMLPRFVVRRTDSVKRLEVILSGRPGFLWKERVGRRVLQTVRSVVGVARYERMKQRVAAWRGE